MGTCVCKSTNAGPSAGVDLVSERFRRCAPSPGHTNHVVVMMMLGNVTHERNIADACWFVNKVAQIVTRPRDASAPKFPLALARCCVVHPPRRAS